jgi:sulfoxide reductase heme-binding subunit YedZ
MRAPTLAAATLGLGAVILGGLALRTADLGKEPWFITRASGLVAFGLVSASVILGLLMSTRLAKRVLPGRLAYDLHGFLAVLTLVFLGVHGGSLLFDSFFAFTPLSVLVPFLSPYEPIWVGLGVIAAWSAALVAGSVRFRKRMGYNRWRRLHYLSFAAYLLALIHGFTAGTDSGLAAAQALYAGSVALIAGLVLVRVSARLVRPAQSASRVPVGPASARAARQPGIGPIGAAHFQTARIPNNLEVRT